MGRTSLYRYSEDGAAHWSAAELAPGNWIYEYEHPLPGWTYALEQTYPNTPDNAWQRLDWPPKSDVPSDEDVFTAASNLHKWLSSTGTKIGWYRPELGEFELNRYPNTTEATYQRATAALKANPRIADPNVESVSASTLLLGEIERLAIAVASHHGAPKWGLEQLKDASIVEVFKFLDEVQAWGQRQQRSTAKERPGRKRTKETKKKEAKEAARYYEGKKNGKWPGVTAYLEAKAKLKGLTKNDRKNASQNFSNLLNRVKKDETES